MSLRVSKSSIPLNFTIISFSGISLGSIYAIIALGYTMVYGIAKMLNFAHGDVIMVGAYVCFYAVARYQLPAVAGVALAMFVCTILGIVVERLAYKPLPGTRAAPSWGAPTAPCATRPCPPASSAPSERKIGRAHV